jgi:hypothetical protein
MKSLCAVALLTIFVSAGAYAADDKMAPKNSQQSKMATCQAEAGEKKLESKARQDYVNNCLKAKPAAAAKPKSKMAECNTKTKGMAKEEANKARAECMKG